MAIKILIVAATDLELKPLLNNRDCEILTEDHLKRITFENKKIDILITSIGMVPTSFYLTLILSRHNYDCVINMGICGAFDASFLLGDVVNVEKDTFAELAYENDEELALLKLGDSLGEEMLTLNINNLNPIKSAVIDNLRKVNGVTVSTITGSQKKIDYFSKMYAPDVESMEGAAFLYVCNALNQPCAQIRSISNFIGNPDKKDWNIELAVNNLAEVVLRIIDELRKSN